MKEWMIESFEPWDITLNAVRQKGTENSYFAKFGLEQCEWPGTASIAANRSEIVRQFNGRYGYRFLGYETLEEWQNMLQQTLDEIAPEFERAFKLYADNAAELMRASRGRTVTYNNLKDQESGTTVSDGKGSTSDTPDAAVNLLDDSTDNFVTSANRNKNTTTHGRANTRTGSVTEDDSPEGGELININANIDSWRNLIRDFVGRFEKHFSKIYWY